MLSVESLSFAEYRGACRKLDYDYPALDQS